MITLDIPMPIFLKRKNCRSCGCSIEGLDPKVLGSSGEGDPRIPVKRTIRLDLCPAHATSLDDSRNRTVHDLRMAMRDAIGIKLMPVVVVEDHATKGSGPDEVLGIFDDYHDGVVEMLLHSRKRGPEMPRRHYVIREHYDITSIIFE